jgi:hypothetical protein
MGHLLKIKCVDSWVNVHILASTSVPFTLTMVQVPNLALTHTRRITVWPLSLCVLCDTGYNEPATYTFVYLAFLKGQSRRDEYVF